MHKLVVTNLSALSGKYGDGVGSIREAVDGLIAADAARGVTTDLIGLDDAATMERHGVEAVTDSSNPREAKAAIDGLHRAVAPEYLLLLGAIDVIPHQPLRNPIFSSGGDPDEFAFSDLPYACEAPFSEDPAAFIGPTRVVGRMPDVTGGSETSYLRALLDTAASWQSRPREEYQGYLGISASVWRGSSELSIQTLFGSADHLKLSPHEGPAWPADLLSRRAHFINCHGAISDSHFYGQEGAQYPIAHDATLLGGLEAGTVASVECCYGAELFDPSAVGGTSGICNAYLEGGAYGFFGSSTIAYGPAEGNGAADLLCQFFLRHMLGGASLGRAALQARQEFILTAPVLDPIDLKTLAQFSLMGDPSIHPVQPARLEFPVGPDELPAVALAESLARESRRRNLRTVGLSLLQSTSVARALSPWVEGLGEQANVIGALSSLTGRVTGLDALLSLPEVQALQSGQVLSFQVDSPLLAKATGISAPVEESMHVVIGQGASEGPSPDITAVVTRERRGELVSYQERFSR